MYIKVKIVIMSHLSDIQANPTGEANNTKLNFVKYLILGYNDTNELIDADFEFGLFCKQHPNLV